MNLLRRHYTHMSNWELGRAVSHFYEERILAPQRALCARDGVSCDLPPLTPQQMADLLAFLQQPR